MLEEIGVQLLQETELRKVPQVQFLNLIRILDENETWKELMAKIPKTLDDQTEDAPPKYNTEHIRMIENAARDQKRSCSEILIEEWSISGRMRPTLKHFVDILKNAQLFRAADIVSVDLLKGAPVERPSRGPAAQVDVSLIDILSKQVDEKQMEKMLDNMHYPNSFSVVGHTFDQNLDYNLNKNDNSKSDSVKHISKEINFGLDNTADGNVSISTVMTDLEISDGPRRVETAETQSMYTSGRPDISMLLRESKSVDVSYDSGSATVSQTDTTEKTDVEAVNSRVLPGRDIIPNFNLLNEREVNPNAAEFDPTSMSDLNVPMLSVLYMKSEPIVSNSTVETNLSTLTSIPHIEYSTIERATGRFDDRDYDPKQPDGGHRIGRGGSGTVYLATGLFGERKVCVKKLSVNASRYLSEEMLLRQFVNEVQTLSDIDHENIVSLLGYSGDGPNYCLVYEYLDGKTLRDNIADSVDFGNTTRLAVALGVARGLEYLHYGREKSLVHRDVKSVNILLTKSRIPKLCDFGIIKQITNATMTSNIIGTNAYMAPEAFRGDISVQMDVFSYGVVLLELLTGLPPYDENRSGNDLVTFIMTECEDGAIGRFADERVDGWRDIDGFYALITRCLDEKRRRPSITEAIKALDVILRANL